MTTPSKLRRRYRLSRLLCVFGALFVATGLALLAGSSTRSAAVNQQDHPKDGPVNSQEPQGRSFKPGNGVHANAAGITEISLATKDLLYDPARQTIYASVPSNGAANANNVVTINPGNGQIGSPVTNGNNPGQMALSGDNQYLYVSLDDSSIIRRLDLQSQTSPSEFSLGIGSFDRPLFAEEIEVLPGQPQSVAIALQDPGHQGVAIFDNGTARANRTGLSPQNDAIEFAGSASTLFGINTTTTEFGFHRLAIDANGITQVSGIPNLLGNNEADIKFDNGLMYGTNGQVVDPQTSSLIGRFHLPGFGYAVAPDSANNRVYFISAAATDFAPKLWAYDMTTFLPVANVTLSTLSGWPHELIRCGAGGLAVRTSDNQVFLIQLTAIQPISATPLPVPTVGPDSVIKLQLAANDLIFDPGTQKVYASLPGSVGSFGNSLAPINPATGVVSQPVPIGADPTKLTISSNNQYIYAG